MRNKTLNSGKPSTIAKTFTKTRLWENTQLNRDQNPDIYLFFLFFIFSFYEKYQYPTPLATIPS